MKVKATFAALIVGLLLVGSTDSASAQVAAAAAQGGDCGCDDWMGGPGGGWLHSCGGGDGTIECDHPGTVHSACDVHGPCNGMGMLELEEDVMGMGEVLLAAERFGGSRLVGAVVVELNSPSGPQARFEARSQVVQLIGCDGKVAQSIPVELILRST